MLGFTSPWWLTVFVQHGLAPFGAASATAGWAGTDHPLYKVGEFLFQEKPILSLLAGLGVLGALVCLLRADWLVPVWLALIFVLTPRSAPTLAMVPLALLAGIGAVEIVWAGLERPLRIHNAWLFFELRRRLPVLVGVAVLLAAPLVYQAWTVMIWSRYSLDSLPSREREAMAWVADYTPVTATFLVLSPKTSWGEDYFGEWFPVLAGRKNVLTPQGAEWLPDNIHARRACLFNQVRSRLVRNVNDLKRWARDRNVHFTHVYVSKSIRGHYDLEPMRGSLLGSRDYALLYENDGAFVFTRRVANATPSSDRGSLYVSSDCRTLFEEPPPTQELFALAYGDLGPLVWVDEHDRVIGERRSLKWLGFVLGFGLSR
ncbi:MAG: hypothetical protein HY329_01980 [Chloroflexi bacterium]|nr:hypothetical protein [Chloroflexota bacterium]